MVLYPTGEPILRGWQEKVMPKLWRFTLSPSRTALLQPKPDTKHTNLTSFSAYDLTSVEALVRYLHLAANFSIKSTWLRSIKAGNFATWTGLTYSNAAKYFPQSIKKLKGKIVLSRQDVQSKQSKIDTQRPTTKEMDDIIPPEKTNEINVLDEPINKP